MIAIVVPVLWSQNYFFRFRLWLRGAANSDCGSSSCSALARDSLKNPLKTAFLTWIIRLKFIIVTIYKNFFIYQTFFYKILQGSDKYKGAGAGICNFGSGSRRLFNFGSGSTTLPFPLAFLMAKSFMVDFKIQQKTEFFSDLMLLRNSARFMTFFLFVNPDSVFLPNSEDL